MPQCELDKEMKKKLGQGEHRPPKMHGLEIDPEQFHHLSGPVGFHKRSVRGSVKMYGVNLKSTRMWERPIVYKEHQHSLHGTIRL